MNLWQWSPEMNSFVDNSGTPRLLPADGDDRAALVLERNGSPVGALLFDAALRDQPQLLEGARNAAALILHNGRVEQQLREQLEEVRRSRERIVTAGDSRRRQLERDLHDGAQQRLVVATMGLARARRAAATPEVRDLLEQASEDLAAALRELRDPDGGLLGLADRAAALGGTLELRSPPGKGTTIAAVLPYAADSGRDPS
ncbi:histidine kinase [Arthrobacter celericrescens]|uniref:histidine kinase n=1 Tax=Arthrobacter celericrescens TaxID=2320851 RepID=UPI001FE0ACCA|nr:histidine kinase [Arthrobacter celericrescens]